MRDMILTGVLFLVGGLVALFGYILPQINAFQSNALFIALFAVVASPKERQALIEAVELLYFLRNAAIIVSLLGLVLIVLAPIVWRGRDSSGRKINPSG